MTSSLLSSIYGPSRTRGQFSHLPRNLQSHLRTKSVTKTQHYAVSAFVDSRLSNWSCFSAHSWTRSFLSSLLHLSWAFLFSADEDARREEDGFDAGIELYIFAELEGFWQRVSTHGRRRWAGISSIIKQGSILVDIVETLLHITYQIISELKHPRYCFPKFVSIWPAPEVVDGIFEVCPSATKFCPLVNKLVALGFSLWWQIFDINKQFCPLVRLGPMM